MTARSHNPFLCRDLQGLRVGYEGKVRLEQRVGVHTRDVPSKNLARIEQSFRNGSLRILCATTTIEAGINLPVDTVIQAGLRDHMGDELSPRHFEQRFGRAGRTIGGEERPGKGIVYVQDPYYPIERIIIEKILGEDQRSESVLNADYRALLLLVFLSSSQRDSGEGKEDLVRILSKSYWSFGRESSDIAKSATQAINLLLDHDLIREGSKAEAGRYYSTQLGSAIASALLEPPDAPSVAKIVEVAERTTADSSWMPEVLFAACQTPSLANNRRSPREGDIVLTSGLGLRRTLERWLFSNPLGSGYMMGFPGTDFKKMKLGPRLGATIERLKERRISFADLRSLLRTYISWLWATGEQVEHGKHVRRLSDHIIRQDLGDYLSHLLRAASWLAQYRGRFILELRLRELSRQVAHGVKAENLEFFDLCQEHLSRASIASLESFQLTDSLNGLRATEREELLARISHRHSTRLASRVESAIENLAADPDDKVWFERISGAETLARVVGKVWQELDSIRHSSVRL